jgi:hypothetical protein
MKNVAISGSNGGSSGDDKAPAEIALRAVADDTGENPVDTCWMAVVATLAIESGRDGGCCSAHSVHSEDAEPMVEENDAGDDERAGATDGRAFCSDRRCTEERDELTNDEASPDDRAAKADADDALLPARLGDDERDPLRDEDKDKDGDDDDGKADAVEVAAACTDISRGRARARMRYGAPTESSMATVSARSAHAAKLR